MLLRVYQRFAAAAHFDRGRHTLRNTRSDEHAFKLTVPQGSGRRIKTSLPPPRDAEGDRLNRKLGSKLYRQIVAGKLS